jgi:hypothetical protein
MKDEALKLALEALKQIDEAMPFPVAKLAQAAIKEALAQPEQEPVAWMDEFGNVFPLGAQRGPKHLNEPMKPLYTTPPQRKPLTDEEIGAILEDINAFGTRLYTFARAIEAAHGIKGEA